MIGFLRGRLLRLAPEAILLDVGGVGYEVSIPLSTYYELERHGEGAEVALHIHTHVREDALALFGFVAERERRLFERLISVSGVGPRLARVVLSGMVPDDLLAALGRGDVARLSTIPGVGKKTAERLVLELRDKIAELATTPTAATPPPPDTGEDLLGALLNLGYRRQEAERAAADARRDHPEAELGELLRLALKRLARL